MIMIGISLICILILSLISGFALYLITGHFISNVLLSIPAFSLIGFFWNKYLNDKARITMTAMDIERQKLESEQSVEVLCSHCKKSNSLKVKLGTRNEYKCRHCGQDNLVLFQFGSSQITVPLVLPEYGVITKEMESKLKMDQP